MKNNSAKKVRFPENLKLKGEIVMRGITITKLAEELNVSRLVVSDTLNGYKKGVNIIPAVTDYLAKVEGK